MTIMQYDVIRNGKKNILAGAANRIILLICPFVERTVLNHVLGAQYLGLGSLFTSILSVLSITELGFGSAMVYNMYKPAAEGNTRKINALLAYYKKTYWIIGLIILGIGLLVLPFLKYLIKGSYPDGIDLAIPYLIFLFNSAISYFLYAYLSSVLVVHQRNDVSSMVNSIVTVGLTACQIVALLTTRNFYLFLILMPVFTLINNLWTARRTHKLFPQYHAEGELAEQDKKQIKKLVTGTFVQQACAVTRNSLDSICISAFLGLTLTAIYNNYFTIFNGVNTFVGIITASFIGGVGNHVATRSVKENYEEMKNLDFVYLWIGGWCTVCLLCLYQPFMTLWMGKEMLLPFPAICMLCMYFYLLKLGDVRYMYSTANGFWWEMRYRAIGETLLNVILNIILGKIFGVYGIIAATIISLFLCNYFWSVGIIFRLYFSHGKRKDYYRYQGYQSLLVIVACILSYGICCLFRTEHLLSTIVIRAIVCIFIPNALFFLIYRKSYRLEYARNKVFGENR